VKILVTGAAGFVGSHVLKRLKESELDVYGIDNFSSYYSVEYKDLRLEHLGLARDSDVMVCDISDFKQVSEIISGIRPDYVIHLAAQAGVRLSLEDSGSYISANVAGFQNIIRSSIENKVLGIVYASSSSVYGDSTPTPYKEDSILLRPKSLYGVTKLSNELFAEIQSKSSNLRFRGLRYFTVYGPWGRPDMAYFRIAAAALGQGKFTLFGDGTIQRDFTYIDDVVDNTIALFRDLMRKGEKFNDIVNIGGSRPLEMNYLIDLISKKGSHQIDLTKVEESKLDSRITMADNSYLKSILGDLKFTELEVGIENLMNWASQEKVKSSLANWAQSTV
jgi:UDP-glucuronate 4-epimerase